MSEPSPLENALKAAGAVWLVLFWIVVAFVVGVIVWALAGPTEAIVIFVAAAVVFVGVPVYLARHQR